MGRAGGLGRGWGEHTRAGKSWGQEWVWDEQDTGEGVGSGSRGSGTRAGEDPAGEAPAVELGLVQEGAGPRQALEQQGVWRCQWPAQHVVAGLGLGTV